LPFKDANAHLRDIYQSILAIQEFVHGMDFHAYSLDTRTQAAVERKLLIISEAAIRLGEEAEALCPGIPWRDIRGIGNWLRHQYDRVECQTVWNTVADDLPPLKASVKNALRPPPKPVS
jgi:uncharacterized protein with HEPN domain